MLKNQHFSFRVALLAILAIIFGVSAYAAPQRSNIPFTQIEYWVGTGGNKAILIVNYCDKNKALAWGYKWDGTKTVAQMLAAIDSADNRLTIVGVGAGYITDFQYNDAQFPNYDFGGTGIMYTINGNDASGVASTNIQDGDVADFGGYNCKPWNLTVSPVRVPSYTIGIKQSSHGTITPQGPITVNEGGSVTLTITPNAGYHLSELKVGTNDVTSAVVGNQYTISNIRANDSVWVKFAVDHNNTIAKSDIQYWVGTGSKEAIFAVNWCNPDSSLAWGYRFSSDTITVEKMLRDIDSADYRLSCKIVPSSFGNFLSEMKYYVNIQKTLTNPSGSYWMYNVNENLAQGISKQKIADGDVIEFGGTACGNIDDYWNIVWTKAIVAVSTPPAHYTIDIKQSNKYGKVTPEGTITVNQGEDITFTIASNAGYHLGLLKVGTNDVTSAVVGNQYTISNVTANDSVVVKFAVDHNNTIAKSDIQYWVGTGSKEAIFAVNWCNPDSSLAWGYRFELSDSVTVEKMLHDIDSADYRLTCRINNIGFGNFLSDMKYYINIQKSLTNPSGSYWVYNVNENYAQGISKQKIADGDVIEFGGNVCGNSDDYWNTVWTKAIVAVPTPPAHYTIGIKQSQYGKITPEGTITVNQGEDVTLTIAPYAGYHLGELKVGNNVVTSAVVGNQYTISNVTANDSVWVKFAVDHNNTITTNDIKYWVGKGNNKVIFASNWCNPDSSLAWGYRFSTDSVTVEKMLRDIDAADSRLQCTISGGFMSSIVYTEGATTLKNPAGVYLMYNVNEEPTMIGIATKKVGNGDIVEFGGYSCGMGDDYENFVWTKNIVAVGSPTTDVDDTHGVALNIYPNPAREYISVDIEGDCTYSIIDMNGRTVAVGTLNGDKTSRTIDISTLDEGIYFVSLTNGNNVYRRKLIVY
ncbi:MAG: T9SS type A sorting domain-containing protein [Bacteroidota bacterium]